MTGSLSRIAGSRIAGSRIAGRIAAVAMIAFIPNKAVLASDTLISPSDEKLCLLYYRLAKVEPPIADFAKHAKAVESSNEFEKEKRTDEEIKRIKSVYDSMADVKFVRVSLNMSMGDYDGQLGEYTLTGFGPDMFVPYYCFETTQLRLRIDNSPYAQSWALDPKAAEKVLVRNKNERSVTAVSTIELTGADSVAAGDPLELSGRVREVDIFSQNTHVPLGHYAVGDK